MYGIVGRDGSVNQLIVVGWGQRDQRNKSKVREGQKCCCSVVVVCRGNSTLTEGKRLWWNGRKG